MRSVGGASRWLVCGLVSVICGCGVHGGGLTTRRVGVAACGGVRAACDGDVLTPTMTDDDDDDDGRRRGKRRRRRRASSPGESRSPRDRAIPPTRHATGRERGCAMIEPLQLDTPALPRRRLPPPAPPPPPVAMDAPVVASALDALQKARCRAVASAARDGVAGVRWVGHARG